MRPLILALLLLLLAGCSAAPPAETMMPPMSEADAFASIEAGLADDEPTSEPVPIWRDRLSGIWRDTAPNGATWTIDLASEQLSVTTGGAVSSSVIRFEREEDRTVYAIIEGRAASRTDAFRFLDENTVIWSGDLGERTLKRQ